MGVVNGTEIVINGTSSIASEIQGSALNTNNTGKSIITVNGGTYGGDKYCMFYVGLKNAASDATETTITQTGASELNLTNGNFGNKTYFFGGGYAYGLGKGAKNTTVQGGVNVSVTGGTFTGTGGIYAGGRADAKGTSLVKGTVDIRISNITVGLGANWTIYGGGYVSGAGICKVEDDVYISISGSRNRITGVLNVYGGGDANAKATGSSSVGSVEIHIGEAARESNLTINNIYGGG